MDSAVANVVDAILTAILQWRVAWLDEQKNIAEPPPICRTQPRKLKITYDNYKDYESTFIPLLMHEIWAQIFEEWSKIQIEISGGSPMDIDDCNPGPSTSNWQNDNRQANNPRLMGQPNVSPRQFWIGVLDYRSDGQFQCMIRCQYLVESNRVQGHLKLIGEGDLVRLDLVALNETQPLPFSEHNCDQARKNNLLSLFAYVTDVTSERATNYTKLAECFTTKPARNYHVINYQVVIAKRPLRLKLSEPMKLSGLYYLKPMIRQIESVAILRESALASDILWPKLITCQLSIPTVVTIKSPHYNDMQYKAIIGTNEALVRNIPKMQLIQGPPGTGKTHTLIGIIKHFYLNWQDSTKMPKILICAPSNGAIDEVAKRLYKEREFNKKGPFKRSLRMVRVGNPDQVADCVKCISLDELVEANANFKLEGLKKKASGRIQGIEKELSRCDTEITNLRFMKRLNEIPTVELKIVHLLKDLEASKAQEEISAKREVSEASRKSMKYELIRNADVILTTLNSCQRHPLDVLFKGENPELSFHCVIVDEASQCCEPELLMPLCYKITKMILIGDPMQLPATVISRHAQDFDFGRSLFERFFIHFGLYNPASPIAMLTEQYRMHPEICQFPSRQFYDNRLITASKTSSTYPLKPYVMLDLTHGFESRSSKNSVENEAEANLVRNLLDAIVTKVPEKSKIGVITPYKAQKRLITNKIRSLLAERNITIDVNTCDGFQGQEKDVIILSCVRSFEHRGSIGFLKSTQRINVALTRAKHSMIICISTRSLSTDKTWYSLIENARERNSIQILTKLPTSITLANMITNTQESQLQPKVSRLIRSNAPQRNQNGFEPEFIMPMDID